MFACELKKIVPVHSLRYDQLKPNINDNILQCAGCDSRRIGIAAIATLSVSTPIADREEYCDLSLNNIPVYMLFIAVIPVIPYVKCYNPHPFLVLHFKALKCSYLRFCCTNCLNTKGDVNYI
jgi:hypothetical protein